MSTIPAMDLTSDQLYSFQTSKCFGDFRRLFPDKNIALAAYALAAQRINEASKPTYVLEWRHIYHDKESGFFLLLFLVTAPLGLHYTRHNEFRFTTTHLLSRSQAHRLILGRSLGSLSYHLCFIFIIVCGVGVFVGILTQLLGHYTFEMTALAVVSFLGLVLLYFASKQTRTLGLPEELKHIAKDAFDLLSIKAIKQATPTN